MKIKKIDDIYQVLKSDIRKRRLVVAYANDSHSIDAAYQSIKEGLVEGILVGDKNTIEKVCEEKSFDKNRFKIVHESGEMESAQKAVELIREGKADILMKGLVSTDKYMKAILDKNTGITRDNAIISHVVVMESPGYHKLMTLSDVAVIPQPDLYQKIAMIKYVTETTRCLGIECPKVALIAPTEQILPKVQSTMDAAVISKMAEINQIEGNQIIDGPMALDVAIDKEAAKIKKVKSPVAGDADCFIFPNLDAGNVFYKTNTKICNSRQAAILVGAKVPCVLSSRGDTVDTKMSSIALAALLS
ncbi:MAG: phosphate butyryltransferase [Odoribacter sp.]|nr:phosphate butyryltransferase [Odoribacter sp.]